jgi:hypothetical protein
VQFSKKDGSFTKSDDIIKLYEGYLSELKPNQQLHIMGVHETGEKNIKGFTESMSKDFISNYFGGKVMEWEDFDNYFQVIFTVKTMPEKGKYKMRFG